MVNGNYCRNVNELMPGARGITERVGKAEPIPGKASPSSAISGVNLVWLSN